MAIVRSQVQAWMANMHERGLAPNTVAQRLAGVRQLSKWMADPAEGAVFDTDPLLRLNAPKVDTPITPVLTDDQLKAMLKACQGTEFRDRRDEAMVRLMAETGARVNEVLGLDVAVFRGRAEDPAAITELRDADVVTSRAVADLTKLARWSLPLLRPGGRMLALKGERAESEVAEHRAAMSRLGAAEVEVVRCGQGYLSPPTTVVSAVRADRSPAARRRSSRSTERRGR